MSGRIAAVGRLARTVLVYELGMWRSLFRMLASLEVHPHVVEDAGLRVRHGVGVDALVRWEDVAAVRYRMRSLEGARHVQVAGEGPARPLSIGVGSQTDIDLELREPRVLPVRRTGGQPVAVVRLYADDPKSLVARIRAEPAERAPS